MNKTMNSVALARVDKMVLGELEKHRHYLEKLTYYMTSASVGMFCFHRKRRC